MKPCDVPGAQAIIVRLCVLQRDVMAELDPHCHHAADCFCGESGFWPLRSETSYRNELVAIEYIEKVVRDALAERPA